MLSPSCDRSCTESSLFFVSTFFLAHLKVSNGITLHFTRECNCRLDSDVTVKRLLYSRPQRVHPSHSPAINCLTGTTNTTARTTHCTKKNVGIVPFCRPPPRSPYTPPRRESPSPSWQNQSPLRQGEPSRGITPLRPPCLAPLPRRPAM